jgi:hypothetical protein
VRTFVNILRRTWLATVLFLVTSMVIWGVWLSLEAGRGSIAPTLLFCPILWWWLVAGKGRPTALRGLLAGAIIGPLTQAIPSLAPVIWKAYAPAGLGDGEAQATAVVTVEAVS